MNSEEQLEVIEALAAMYMLVGQASPDAFKNGVGEPGQGDEGDYHAGIIIEQARNILRKWEVKGIG